MIKIEEPTKRPYENYISCVSNDISNVAHKNLFKLAKYVPLIPILLSRNFKENIILGSRGNCLKLRKTFNVFGLAFWNRLVESI